MIVADTSVWIDFLRSGDDELAAALRANFVAGHQMVVAELALGNLANRESFLDDLDALPRAPIASDAELRACIAARALHGRGIGFVDAHLIASCLLSGHTLWTRDRRLHEVATELGAA